MIRRAFRLSGITRRRLCLPLNDDLVALDHAMRQAEYLLLAHPRLAGEVDRVPEPRPALGLHGRNVRIVAGSVMGSRFSFIVRFARRASVGLISSIHSSSAACFSTMADRRQVPPDGGGRRPADAPRLLELAQLGTSIVWT
jgi:hypothetical protein